MKKFFLLAILLYSSISRANAQFKSLEYSLTDNKLLCSGIYILKYKDQVMGLPGDSDPANIEANRRGIRFSEISKNERDSFRFCEQVY